ncbi:hypothetical protein [Polaribacter sp. Hel_I_88]|uniref:hypothetical protein n=1 Tax=Polaribacter sp. Hel_I_88 TaxID=1250006 RepID=UPI00047ADC4B|nr:hypothetical protein [Polaribacter sp. Hel_I_88]
MKRKSNFFLLLIIGFVIFSSCFSNINDKKLNIEIYDCVEKKSKKLLQGQYNIYEEFIKTEKLLIEEGILLDNSKISYKKALTELFDSKKTKAKYLKSYNKILDNIDYSGMLFFSETLTTPFSCIGFYLEKNNLHKTDNYSKYYKVLKKAYQDMTPENPQIYYDLIDFTPNYKMDEIIFRAPIISVFIGVLYHNVSIDLFK